MRPNASISSPPCPSEVGVLSRRERGILRVTVFNLIGV